MKNYGYGKDITFYIPKLEYKKITARDNAFQIMYSYRDYSSCVDMIAPKFRTVIPQKRNLLIWNFLRLILLYRVYNYISNSSKNQK